LCPRVIEVYILLKVLFKKHSINGFVLTVSSTADALFDGCEKFSEYFSFLFNPRGEGGLQATYYYNHQFFDQISEIFSNMLSI